MVQYKSEMNDQVCNLRLMVRGLNGIWKGMWFVGISLLRQAKDSKPMGKKVVLLLFYMEKRKEKKKKTRRKRMKYI